MAAALVPLQNITLGSAAASVTFSSIPTTGYRDLRLVINGTLSTGFANTGLRFNGDSATNYSYVSMEGTGSVSNSASGSLTFATASANAPDMTTTVGQVVFDILDYSATDKHKTVLARGNNLAQGTAAVANRWANTSVITSVLVRPNSSTFAAGSTFALYGVVA